MSHNGITRLRPRPASACAQAKCAYCGRFGPLGQCEGCGAPNKPVALKREESPEFIEITAFGDAKRKYLPVMPQNRIVLV